MEIKLTACPRKDKRISTPGLQGLEYRQQAALCRDLKHADAHFVDYVLKPATDEMWNLIDGKRSIGDIVEFSLLEFNLRTDASLWIPVFVGWQKAGLITITSG